MPAVSFVGEPRAGGDLLGGQVGAALLLGGGASEVGLGSAEVVAELVGRSDGWSVAPLLAESPQPARPVVMSTAATAPAHVARIPPPLARLPKTANRSRGLRRAPPLTSLPPVTTFAEVLARRLRADPGQPLVTYYDLGTDERVELSVTTYANWVAKTASLLAEEHDLERGRSLRVDLPTHWLGPVFLGAAWTLGLLVTEDDEPDAVVCGPAGLQHWAAYADRVPVLACSLRPLGVRFADPLPVGVHDVGSGGLVAARRVHAVGPADQRGTSRRLGRRAPQPRRAVEPGRRRILSFRRRPTPLDGEPGFPLRSRRIHRAAGGRRLSRARLGGHFR